jgi:hypothetical protein
MLGLLFALGAALLAAPSIIQILRWAAGRINWLADYLNGGSRTSPTQSSPQGSEGITSNAEGRTGKDAGATGQISGGLRT